MPLIEYICPECNLAWNWRAPVISDSNDFQSCKRCGANTPRQGLPSHLGIQRTGTSSATTDHIVGQDAEVRWDQFQERKEERDLVRKETGSVALSEGQDGYVPASPDLISLRKKAYEALNP